MIQNPHINYFIFSLLIFALGCKPQAQDKSSLQDKLLTDSVSYYYELHTPIDKYFLPYVLEEISGLSYHKNSVLAIDDEKGKVYEFDFKERDITNSIKFHKSGDYEGIEMVGDTIYVLRSDGDIFKFHKNDNEENAEKIETELSQGNDTEGLGYDFKNNRLLIACKAEPASKTNKNVKGKAIYSLSLESNKLNDKPISIRQKSIASFVTDGFNDENIELSKFEPSAIALHPISGNWHILSSVGKMMLVLNSDGGLIGYYRLSRKVFKQPEGICFAPDGTLYISSEGDGDRGYILQFKAHQNK